MTGTGPAARLWLFLNGYVIIKISGARLEQFVNAAAASGVSLWHIRRLGSDVLVAKTPWVTFARIRPLCRRTGCRVRIWRRRGLVFWLARLRSRRWFAAGAAVALLLLWALSGRIWVVDVEGNRKVPGLLIRQAAAEAGLRIGAARGALDPAEVAAAVQRQVDGVAWAGIQMQGVRAVIQVVEARQPDRAAGVRSAHLVAARDGLVTSVVALRGLPLVVEGETVRAGQVLVSGIVPEWLAALAGLVGSRPEGPPSAQGEESAGPVPPPAGREGPVAVRQGELWYTAAQARVEARVWVTGRQQVPLEEAVLLPTGRIRHKAGLQIGNWQGELAWPWRPFAQALVHQSSREIRKPWPVRLYWGRDEEQERHWRRLTPAEARLQALRQAQQRAGAQVPAGARILSRQQAVRYGRGGRGAYAEAEVTLELEMDIASVQAVPVGAPVPTAVLEKYGPRPQPAGEPGQARTGR